MDEENDDDEKVDDDEDDGNEDGDDGHEEEEDELGGRNEAVGADSITSACPSTRSNKASDSSSSWQGLGNGEIGGELPEEGDVVVGDDDDRVARDEPDE